MEEKNMNQRIFDGIKFLAGYVKKKPALKTIVSEVCAPK